jgi:hypothetical protein
MNIKSKYQSDYENGVYPDCYRPCPPFYDICNAAELDTIRCTECFEKHRFIDYIE